MTKQFSVDLGSDSFEFNMKVATRGLRLTLYKDLPRLSGSHLRFNDMGIDYLYTNPDNDDTSTSLAPYQAFVTLAIENGLKPTGMAWTRFISGFNQNGFGSATELAVKDQLILGLAANDAMGDFSKFDFKTVYKLKQDKKSSDLWFTETVQVWFNNNPDDEKSIARKSLEFSSTLFFPNNGNGIDNIQYQGTQMEFFTNDAEKAFPYPTKPKEQQSLLVQIRDKFLTILSKLLGKEKKHEKPQYAFSLLPKQKPELPYIDDNEFWLK